MGITQNGYKKQMGIKKTMGKKNNGYKNKWV